MVLVYRANFLVRAGQADTAIVLENIALEKAKRSFGRSTDTGDEPVGHPESGNGRVRDKLNMRKIYSIACVLNL
jgi:hypothetical protein